VTEARRLYGTDALRPLFAAARRHLEERDLDVGGRITLRGLSDEERAAISWLFGARRPAAGAVSVGLTDLDDALRRQATGLGLREVLTALGGPLVARRAVRRAQIAARASVFDEAAGHPALTRHAELERWLDWLRARGVLSRLTPDVARALLSQALDVLAALPAPPVSLPVFAGRTVGATHGLDRGASLAVIVERALTFLVDEPPADRREIWARFGISLDAVSSTAIVLNLRPRRGPLAALLAAAADAGEPLHVSLRMLRGQTALDVGGAEVFLCENRSIIEAVADELGPRSAPLVCLSGEPTAAGRELVRLLVRGGTRLRYHGDFDPEGVTIANSIIGPDVVAWRFGADDYRAAVARTPISDEIGSTPVPARWDDRLAPAMASARARIYEEHVLEDLLVDLRADAGSRSGLPRQ
jgi:uncharacterized protein (TIGR02679 family)